MSTALRPLLAALVLLVLLGCSSAPRAPALKWLQGARPTFPAGPKSRGVEGHVVVEYSVDAQGRVQNPRVVESVPEGVFDGAALAALRTWVYRPFDAGDGPGLVDGVRSRFDFRLGEAYEGL